MGQQKRQEFLPRLATDSKDLGGDVDLVGPGEAYERWMTTPEYQEWLMETRQME
jgi:hypothetical protein